MKRVLFVTKYFDHVHNGPGSRARLLFETAANGRWPDVELHVLTPDCPIGYSKGSAHVHHLSDVRVAPPRTSNWVFQWRLREAIPDLVRTKGCEVVHFNTAFFAALAIGSMQRLGCKVVVNINDYYDEPFWSTTFLRQAPRQYWMRGTAFVCEKYVSQRASTVLFNSEFTATLMRRRWALPELKSAVVHNAVGLEQFRQRGAQLTNEPALRMLFVGKYWERKGLPDILEALHLLRSNVVLTVAGATGSETGLFEHVLRLGLSTQVRFLGNVPRNSIAELYRQHDVFLLPSHREAFGVAALEAMASGMPVIASRVGGLQELVEDGVTGILVPPGCPVAIADAIRKLGDADVRSSMGQRGHNRAQEFSAEHLVCRLSEIYEQSL